MQRAFILMVVVVALGVAAFFVTREPVGSTGPEPLSVPGYATPEQLEAESRRGMMDSPEDVPHPVDEVVVVREDLTLRFTRDGDGEDATWALVEPMAAPAVGFRVERMVDAFKAPTESVVAQTTGAEELPLYDLEAERRIAVTLKSKGSVWNGVDLVIGKVERGDAPQTPGAGGGASDDTWVMKAGDEGVVYRVAGKDLRTPFEVELADMRDKKLFTAKASELTELEVTSPGGAKVVLKGETPAPAEGGDAPAAPAKTTWTFVEPAGVEADAGVATFANSLAAVRAKAFSSADDGPEGGLGEAVWKLRAKTAGGAALALDVAAAGADGTDSGDVWAQVPGNDEWVTLAGYTAKNLRKGLGTLRNRKLPLPAQGEVTGVTMAPEGAEPVTVTRSSEGQWRFADGALADVDTALGTLVTAQAARWAEPQDLPKATAALTAPAFKAAVTSAAGTWSLVAGAHDAEGDGTSETERWARLDGPGEAKGEPFVLQDYVAKRFRKTRDDLAWKKLFTFDKAALKRVGVVWPDGQNVAVVRGAGGALVPEPLPEGATPAKAALTAIEGTVASLRAKTFVDKTPAEAGLGDGEAYVVTLQVVGEANVTLRISKQKDGEDPFATVDSGPLSGRVFTLNQYQALNLQKGADELVEK